MAGVNQPHFRDPVLSGYWDGSTAVPRVQPPNFERFSSELVATDVLYVSDDKRTLIWYMSEIKRICKSLPIPPPTSFTHVVYGVRVRNMFPVTSFSLSRSHRILVFGVPPPPHRSATSGIAYGCSHANKYKDTHARCTCEY